MSPLEKSSREKYQYSERQSHPINERCYLSDHFVVVNDTKKMFLCNYGVKGFIKKQAFCNQFEFKKRHNGA